MAYCPHCNVRYDETNETQPCCYQCGHPISCGCGGGHSYTPSSPSVPPSVLNDATDDNGESGDNADSGDDSNGDTFSPDKDLPF